MEIPKKYRVITGTRQLNILVDAALIERAKAHGVHITRFFEQQLSLAVEQLDREKQQLSLAVEQLDREKLDREKNKNL